jgi:DNA-binding NtrC family response regulator
MALPTDKPPLLIVDDDRDNCLMLSKLLQLRGYPTDYANDGTHALEMLDQKHYRLAIIDYRMPGMNGVDLYREMHARQPDLVGVFLTGYPTIDTVFPAIDAGVARVLAKPVNTNELVHVIEEHVGTSA